MTSSTSPSPEEKAEWNALLGDFEAKHGERWRTLLRAAVRQERRFANSDTPAPLHAKYADDALAAQVADAFGHESLSIDEVLAWVTAGPAAEPVANRYPEVLRPRVSRLGTDFVQGVVLTAMARPGLALEPLLALSDEALVWWERARVAEALGYPKNAEEAREHCRSRLEPGVYRVLAGPLLGGHTEPS